MTRRIDPPFPPKELLVATDLSEVSLAAFDYARLFVERFGCRVTTVHAEDLDVPPYFREDQVKAILDQVRNARADAVRHVEQEAARALGRAPRVRIVEGPASDGILSVARGIHADLILMGSHGRSGLERVWLGSVTARVLRQTGVPLLAVAERREEPRLDRILCPVSPGVASEQALRYAGALQKAFGSRVTVLHAKQSRESGDRAAELVERAGVDASFEQVEEHPVEAILRAANAGDYDAVVLGSRRRSSLWAELFSSTTERVMQALRRPLFVVPVKGS